MTSGGVVLYIGCRGMVRQHIRKLDGIRRFARSRGWRVVAVPPTEARPDAVKALLAKSSPVGCVVECSFPESIPAPRLFGATPVVYLDPQMRPAWRGATTLTCDNAAVAASAFHELSAALPPSYAVVTYRFTRLWARERAVAFQALCSGAGRECAVFRSRYGEGEAERARRMEMWAASLPRHCAVFAVNDFTAWEAQKAIGASFRNVPRDVTILGVDGYDRLPDGEVSRLSSVKLDFEHSGFMAARMLATGLAAKDAKTAKGNSAPSAFSAAKSFTFGPLLVQRRESTRGFGRREPRILEAVEIIRAEACDGLTAESLARRFRCSRNLFERRFREAMGHSVLDEILHVRLEQVQSLLTRPDVGIGAIAGFCGFNTERELQKLFRSRMGTTMRQWRKNRL
jgi:AraC-like DNA-binding protein